MKPTVIYLLATSLAFSFIGCSCAGCSPPSPPKPSPVRPRPDGEKALRDSLAHTHQEPRRK